MVDGFTLASRAIKVIIFNCSYIMSHKVHGLSLAVTGTVHKRWTKKTSIGRKILPANTKHLHNICTTSSQHCTNVIQMFYVCWAGLYRYSTDNTSGSTSQQTRGIEPLLVQCWSTFYDAGPTLNQQWLNASCLQHPSKHEALSHCWFNVGPPSTTLAQHWTNFGSMPRVCWDYAGHFWAIFADIKTIHGSLIPGVSWLSWNAQTHHCSWDTYNPRSIRLCIRYLFIQNKCRLMETSDS